MTKYLDTINQFKIMQWIDDTFKPFTITDVLFIKRSVARLTDYTGDIVTIRLMPDNTVKIVPEDDVRRMLDELEI